MKMMLIAFAALVLSGCGTFQKLYGFDAAQLDTANKQIAFGLSQVEGFSQLTFNLLLSDTINATQAQRVKSNLDDAFNVLDAARLALLISGDPVAAQTEIEKATRSIQLALIVLNEFAPPGASSRQPALIIKKEYYNEYRLCNRPSAKCRDHSTAISGR